ncbi:MAG: glutaminase A [Oscillospiraceae bacterium]
MYQKELDAALNYARSFLYQGNVATYIPELSKASPNALGACIALPTGEFFCGGDCEKKFTMQSISKLISLILALQTSGYDKVFKKVGMEPTGDPFNSIIKLETKTAKPSNPMINAGAIVVASLIDSPQPFEEMLALTKKFTLDDDVFLDEKVYRSEKSQGMRNRAMAYFMMSEGIIEGDVESYLDTYFKMCSVSVSAKGLANLGMIFANDGINPFTGERIAEDWQLRIVKTFMVTCGLYDSSGEFAVKVGIPSKSGVGGGIVSVATNGMGIGVYGPALDLKGNSVGGVRILEYLSQNLDLHMFAQRKSN